jgi:hypothetical protein
MSSVTVGAASRREGGYRRVKGGGKRIRGKVTIRGGVIIYVSRGGRITHGVMGRRRAGWAKYAPLRRYNGGEARRADGEEKTQTGRFAFFLPCGPRPRGGGCPSPFELWKDGFATGAERSEVEGANPSYLLLRGGSPAARGRDNKGRHNTAA